MLTVAQALRLLPIGRSTLYAFIESGRLPAYRVQAAPGRRGRLLISRRDLAVLLDNSRTGGHTAAQAARADVDAILSRLRKGA